MAINYPVIFKTDTSALDKAGGSLKKFGGIAAGVGAAAGAAIAGIAVTSIKEFAKFDSALNKSISIMGDVSDTLQTDMADAAKEVAKTTSFSAEEAAESYFFLASAGLDAAASVAAMPQVAAFAQAGMFDMALATDLATDAQSALGLASDDANENLANLTRVTDVFVKANTLANTSVEQLATAMTSKAGNALKTVGKDIEEGSAALAVFADQGIKGERAGTLLTNTLFGLTDAAEKNPGVLRDMNVEIFDAEGNMRNMADIAGQLSTSLDGMSTEAQIAQLSQLGLTKQAREGVLALVGQEATLAEYEAALRSAGGTAEEVANKQLMTLEGQLGLLKDSFNVAAIEIGESFEPATVGIVASIADLSALALPKVNEFFDKAILPGFEYGAERLGVFTEDLASGMNIGEALKANAGDIGADIADFFSNIDFGELLARFNELRMNIIMGILDALPGIVEGIVEFIPQLVSFITDTLIPTMLDQATKIFTEILNVLVEVLPTILEGIAEMIPALIESLAGLLPTIIDTIVEFIPTILEAAIDVFNSLVDALIIIIPDLITTLVELIPQILTTLLEALPKILDAGMEFFMSLVEALIEIVPELLDAVIEMIPQIVDTLVDALPKIIDASVELFLGLIDGLVEMIPDLLTAIIEMIPRITTQLIEALPDIIDAAFELFDGVIGGLIEATPKILTAVIDLIPEITGALIDNIPKLVDAGFEIISGLAKGLIDNAPRVIGNAMNSVGETVVNGFKSFLGIQSPSKVFMGLGGDVVAGLEEGLGKGEGLLAKASVDMAQTLQVSSENVLSGRSSFPVATSSATPRGGAGNQNIVINVNAGMGADGQRIGQQIVDEIIKFERTSGKVFARA